MKHNNCNSDVVLKKDEVIRFIDGKLVKTKLNLELLNEKLENIFVKKNLKSQRKNRSHSSQITRLHDTSNKEVLNLFKR